MLELGNNCEIAQVQKHDLPLYIWKIKKFGHRNHWIETMFYDFLAKKNDFLAKKTYDVLAKKSKSFFG